jgi:RimJ/RimL family protein N-acetyltransferase
MKTFTDCSVASAKFMCEVLGVNDVEHSSALVCMAEAPVAGMLFTRQNAETAIVGIWIDDAHKVPRTWGYHVFNYAFNVLGVERLVSYAEVSNTKSIEITERVGFKCVDTSPDGSVNVYQMLREDCHMLDSKKWGRAA